MYSIVDSGKSRQLANFGYVAKKFLVHKKTSGYENIVGAFDLIERASTMIQYLCRPSNHCYAPKEFSMSLEVPEIDNCCEKETYAFFGLAAYWAQVLEHSTLNLVIVLNLPGTSLMSQEIFDNLYNSLTKKTFGQLLKASKDTFEIPEADERYLNEALELRNILTHHYFREHAENLVSEVGRREIKKELQLIISKFKRADEIFEGICAPLWVKYGVTEEFVNEQLEDLRIKAEARDKDA